MLQYSIGEYRDRLYLEIVKRKKEIRRRMKEREAARAASKSSSKASRSRNGTVAAPGYVHGGNAYAPAEVYAK